MKKMQKNEGFTLIELLIVVAIIGIIAAIAVPGLLRARMSGNEASAIGSIRTIASAEATFASACGGGGYAVSLADLAAPPASGPKFIPEDLELAAVGGGAPKSGYEFSIASGDGVGSAPVDVLDAGESCNSSTNPTMTGFFATTAPASPGSTGVRYFATDETGMIRQNSAGAVTDMTVGIPLQ